MIIIYPKAFICQDSKYSNPVKKGQADNAESLLELTDLILSRLTAT